VETGRRQPRSNLWCGSGLGRLVPEGVGFEGVGVWRRDVSTPEVIEGRDGGWDVSSQRVLVSKAWECGDETSPTPKSLWVWIGAGTSRPRKSFGLRGEATATRRHHPQPPPQAEGAGILGTGDRGWRPDGLTPGYCLKPLSGF